MSISHNRGVCRMSRAGVSQLRQARRLGVFERQRGRGDGDVPNIAGYVVVTAQAKLKTARRHVQFFKTERAATRFASAPGDSVMAVTVDMSQQPVFIRELAL